MNNLDKARALLKSIETVDLASTAYLDPAQYTQHNLRAADGVAGFVALLHALPKGEARVNTVRAFQDGDYVVAHTDYHHFGPHIGFDIFRFEWGMIVEHWDNLQPTPPQLSPGGHSMLDGPTEVEDLDRTAENKRLVRTFVDEVLVHGRRDRLPAYFYGDRYIQHNPQMGDGLTGFLAGLDDLDQRRTPLHYQQVHLVLGSGNFVLTASEGRLGSQPTSFYDLFRVENGKLAEHWDTLEPLLPRAEWKNQNGKF